jgi:hypothetical protein
MTMETSLKKNSTNIRRQRMPSYQSNIITHLRNKYYEPASTNPEEPKALFSVRKSIPLNAEVIRERSEMIVHPSYFHLNAAKSVRTCPTGSKEIPTSTTIATSTTRSARDTPIRPSISSAENPTVPMSTIGLK